MWSLRSIGPLAVLVGIAAGVHLLTGDPFLYLPAVAGVAAALGLEAGLRAYRRGTPTSRRTLVGAGFAALGGVAVLFAWAIATSPPTGAAWVVAAALFLLPLSLAVLLARRNGARGGT